MEQKKDYFDNYSRNGFKNHPFHLLFAELPPNDPKVSQISIVEGPLNNPVKLTDIISTIPPIAYPTI